MRTRRQRSWLAGLLAFAALSALGGCVDFVEPDSLKLETPVRLQTTLSVAGSAGCGMLPAGQRANVCLETTLNPGQDRYGRARRLLDERLTALGEPLTPAEVRADSTRVYRGAWHIDEARLADTMLVLVHPQVEGVALDPATVRWRAVGRPGPDTLRVSREGVFGIDLLPPHRPRPRAAGHELGLRLLRARCRLLHPWQRLPLEYLSAPGLAARRPAGRHRAREPAVQPGQL